MNLSFSNIAWTSEEDEAIYKLLNSFGIKYIDIAPGRNFNNPLKPLKQELNHLKRSLEEFDLKIGGMQSLVFGRNDLEIFGEKNKRIEFIEYLKKVFDLGNKIGASSAIFGSPKNRIVGDMDKTHAKEIAIEFFSTLSNYAMQANITICLEPNPTIYGGDFITNTKEAFELVSLVNHEYFKINLDLGTIIANDEEIKISKAKIDEIGHVHISEPYLKPIESDLYKTLITELNKMHYENIIAIEMAKVGDDNELNIRNTLEMILG